MCEPIPDGHPVDDAPADELRSTPWSRAQRFLVWLDHLALKVFFRQVEVEGLEHVPVEGEGPLLVVANHVNGLIDPMLVLGSLPLFPRFLGKSTLWDIKPLRPFLEAARVIPVYRRQDQGVDISRNREAFAASRRVLTEGGVLCLFPEGKSHNEPNLAPLKTGAARMALEAGGEALAESGRAAGVRFLPVGLSFDAKERFRSRALVEIGQPFSALEAAGIAGVEALADLAASVTGEAGAPPEAVRDLTDAIDAALQDVTLNFDTWEEARLLRRAAQIYRTPALDVPRRSRLSDSAPLLRAFADGYRVLSETHPEEVRSTAEAVRRYDQLLTTAGLRDRHVASTYPLPPVAGFLRRSLGTLLVRLPLALVGTVLNALPFLVVKAIGRRVKGLDQKATWKIFPALLAYPLTWIAEAVAAGWWVGNWSGSAWSGWLLGIAVLALAPLSGWEALLFHDRRSRILHEVRAFLKLRTRGRFTEVLRGERHDIRRRVGRLVELYRSEVSPVPDPSPIRIR